MTRNELKTRLKTEFDNTENFNDSDYDTAIQDGYEEVIALSGCIFKSVELNFTNGLTYYDLRSLVPDFLGIVAIFNTVTNLWLEPTTLRRLETDCYDWEVLGGTPFCFVPISHRYMAIHRKPLVDNYGSMYLFYRATAPVLSGSTDILIHEDHIKCLEDYAFMDLFERLQEFSKALNLYAEYIKGLDRFRQTIKNSRLVDRLPILK